VAVEPLPLAVEPVQVGLVAVEPLPLAVEPVWVGLMAVEFHVVR